MSLLTEEKLQEMFEATLKADPQPNIMLGAKQLALLRAKYPEIYDKPYKCSFQRMIEENAEIE